MRTGVVHMLLAALVLSVFALLGSSLLAVTAELTREQIAENQRRALLRSLHEVIPRQGIDNDLFADRLTVQDPRLGRDPVTVYRGRRDGRVASVAFSATAPDGYNGRIRLLVGVDRQGAITGVRVLEHHETPGLGDDIELERSDWIRGFDGRSLSDPADPKAWAVRRDGGQFEQFTGATITPRAVVKAVHGALRFVNEHQGRLFETDVEPPATAATKEIAHE